MIKIARSLFAVIAGYAAMVVLITLAQEVLYGGVSYHDSSLAVLVGAGGLTFLSAVAGGALAAWIAGRAYRLHAAVMVALVALETTLLVVTGRIGGPLWFDLLASASLVVGLLIGAESFALWRRTRESPGAGVS